MLSATLCPTAPGRSPVLHLDVAHLGGAAILRLAGHLGAPGAAPLAGALGDLLDTGVAVVVIDLLDLDSVDDAGVLVLVAAAERARGRAAAVRILADAPRTLDALRADGAVLDVCDLTGGRP
jgi:anti-anti-sigma factor